MYILSITLTKAKLSAISAILLLGVLIIIYIVPQFFNAQTVSAKYTIKNSEKGRQDFINSLGWEVADKPYLIESMKIPDEFDKFYESYNQLQKTHELNLEPFKGKKVQKYTYRITNYKDESIIVYINIFVYMNSIIAGDINCPDLRNGFIRNFLDIEV